MNILFDQDFNDPTSGGNYDGGGSSAGDYAGDAAYYAKEGATAAKQGIKKLIPIIVLGIIALVVIGFVLSFLGSQQTINFSIKELDGDSITSARIVVKDSAGNKLLSESGSSHTLTLGPGNYTVRITSGEHGSFTEPLIIPRLLGTERDNEYVANLKKNLEGNLEITLSETEIYEKQILVGEIKITNTGDAMTDEKMLVGNKTSSDLENDINFSPTIFSISSGGTRIIEFTMTLKTDISETKEGEDIEFRIAGTNISSSKKMNLIPAIASRDIEIKGDIKDKILKDHQLVAGEQEDYDFDIDNDNRDLPLNDVTLTIIPEDEDSAENLSWFEFADYTGENHIKTISSIDPNNSTTITLKVTPTIDSEVGDKFKGILKIESLGIQERTIPISFDFMVEESKQARLEISTSNLSTECYTSMEPCKVISTFGKIKIENTGDADLGTINVDWDIDAGSSDNCEAWIEFASKTVSGLEIDAVHTMAFDLLIPDGETTQFTSCYLKATYEDPLDGSTNVNESDPFQIKITIKEKA